MLIKCSECGKTISDTAKTCPHCGAPVNVIKDKVHEVTVVIGYIGATPLRNTDMFHILVDGTPVGLVGYNTPFKIGLSKSSTLSIKLKNFMQYRSEPILLEYGKVSYVKYVVTYDFPTFRSPKATYKVEEIR